MEGNMKASGSMISVMAKVSSATQMETHTSVNLNLEKLMEKASTLGRTAKCTMVSGTKVSSKATVYGRVSRTTPTLASGPLPRLMDTACITGLMEIAMKASGRCASSMDKALIALLMEMFILDHMSTVSLTVKVSMSGQLAKSTLETSIEERSMVKESGEAQGMSKVAMSTKVSIRTIASTARVSSPGPVAIFTRATTSKTSARAMAKCFGLTVACTKVSGSAASSMVSAA